MSEVTVSTPPSAPIETSTMPGMATTLGVIGILFFVASLVVGVNLWPETSYRYDPTLIDFIPSMIWIVAGVIECALFMALAQVLAYLDRIARATEARITARV
ncbi:hypothetical protein J7355_16815 [Endozoicomonas sp. G2_2]|uniref:hypothetical protein n=1 Tax=Endozoicomonas sp. G2_2 TaxID=2821092 RepID=UPI001AD97EB2|nr:hypothetical protein [Endozoicomonas sp. G2_2]MBO9471755.1 hypothetical protein [Endozoicomonas sp. G2_2]